MRPRSVASINPISLWFLLAPALVLAALAAGACARTEAQQPAEAPPVPVTVAAVIDREVTEWDEFTGRLEAVDTVAIRPRVSGYISSLLFDEGAVVRKGQLLFQIDPRPFEAEVDRLRAELTRATAVVKRGDSEFSRAGRLQAENAIAHEEFERRSAFRDEARAQLAAVEAALRAAELNLEFTRVASPISGRAGRAVVTEGNLVSTGPGEATLLTTVVSLDPIYAYFDADEQIFLRYQGAARSSLSPGARGKPRPVQMALASDDGFPRSGRLDFLDNQLNPATGTIRGRAVFSNPHGELTPGLFVRLRLSGGGRHRGVLIQDRAVGTDLGRKFVYVVDDGGVVGYREVTLGPVVDGFRVVQTGLAAGDRIVLNGLQRVRPGVKVAPSLVAMDALEAPRAAAPTASTH
jgi:membrane fusion protein, multidrug efflux system